MSYIYTYFDLYYAEVRNEEIRREVERLRVSAADARSTAPAPRSIAAGADTRAVGERAVAVEEERIAA